MRNFINAVLTENWAVGEPFLTLDAGSHWYSLNSEEEMGQALTALRIREHGRFPLPAYVLVHDNRPVMIACVDEQTGKISNSALQGGIQPDAGWSAFTLPLEQKFAGPTDTPMEGVEVEEDCVEHDAIRKGTWTEWQDRDGIYVVAPGTNSIWVGFCSQDEAEQWATNQGPEWRVLRWGRYRTCSDEECMNDWEIRRNRIRYGFRVPELSEGAPSMRNIIDSVR